MSRTLFLFIALTTSLSLAFCHHKTVPVSSSATVDPDKILFLAYEVTRDSVSGKIATKILYQKTADGSVKAASLQTAPDDVGNWQIAIRDKKDFPIELFSIENPLHKKLEYVGADGALGMKEVWLNRAEVVVRVNYKKTMEKVSLAEIESKKIAVGIFSHHLQLTDK